jgi:hypothetical protein
LYGKKDELSRNPVEGPIKLLIRRESRFASGISGGKGGREKRRSEIFSG